MGAQGSSSLLRVFARFNYKLYDFIVMHRYSIMVWNLKAHLRWAILTQTTVTYSLVKVFGNGLES